MQLSLNVKEVIMISSDQLDSTSSNSRGSSRVPVSAGLVVLQWLTYAFWGWTVLALSILTSMVIANFIGGADVGGATPYGIAAILVLLPISYICDVFYSKREPTHKSGPETLVMVIHAVLFALFGIGALIFAVFAMIKLLTSGTDVDSTLTALLSSLIIAVYYGLTFLRTLNPAQLRWIQRYYKFVMLITISIIAILGIIGPVAKERSLRDDKLIVQALPELNYTIQSYAQDNKKLPDNLQELDLEDDTKQLVDRNLVTYKPEDSITEEGNDTVSNNNRPSKPLPGTAKAGTVYRYQLCVTYKEKSGSSSGYEDLSSYDSSGYTNYLSTYQHKAGNVCYKLKTNPL